MNSILNDIKKLMGIDESYDCYDTDLIIFINSALAEVVQLGYSSNMNAKITGSSETWNSIFTDITNQLELVKEFVYLKTKIVFDPPQSSAVLSAYNDRIKELQWRLNISPSVEVEES